MSSAAVVFGALRVKMNYSGVHDAFCKRHIILLISAAVVTERKIQKERESCAANTTMTTLSHRHTTAYMNRKAFALNLHKKCLSKRPITSLFIYIVNQHQHINNILRII